MTRQLIVITTSYAYSFGLIAGILNSFVKSNFIPLLVVNFLTPASLVLSTVAYPIFNMMGKRMQSYSTFIAMIALICFGFEVGYFGIFAICRGISNAIHSPNIVLLDIDSLDKW